MLQSFSLQHVLAWLGILLGGGVFYVFAIITYRIFFHPLAKYPGPVIAKVTDAYQLYYAWRGDRHLQFWRLHQKYGKTIRFGPNSLSFSTNQSLQDIYGFKANVRKSEFYDSFAHPVHNTHNTRDKAVHARKRRVLSHAFSESAMKDMQRFILNNVRLFCEQLGIEDGGADSKGWTQPRKMDDWCNYLAIDVLGDLCYGKSFRMLESADNRFALDLVEAATTRHLVCGTMPIVNNLGLDKYMFPALAAGRARFMTYSKAQLTERTKLGEDADRRDFFWYLLKARDPETGEGFTTPELWAESNLLIIAGSDTTSTAMAATLFYLTRNPAAMKKVVEEIRGKFNDVEEIVQGPALSSCSYLKACIDEAMRMSPSVGGIPPREVMAGGATIDGEVLPEGTVVGTAHYNIHHNEAYYPQSFTYVPERWVSGDMNPITGKPTTKEEVERAHSAFVAWSLGPRGCIGKAMAYVEMTLSLGRAIYLYDMRRAVGVQDISEGHPDLEFGRHRETEFQLRDIFTSGKCGPLVEFRRAEKA